MINQPIQLPRQQRVQTWQVCQDHNASGTAHVHAEFRTLEEALGHWLAHGSAAYAYIRNSSTGKAFRPAPELRELIAEIRNSLGGA
jgi:hypothetical protein